MQITKIRFLAFLFLFTLMFSCDFSVANQKDIIKIQKLDDFLLDGNFHEWNKIPFRKIYSDPYGNCPYESDLQGGFKIAWKDDHLLLYFEIFDDKLVADTVFPWKGDAIELFLMDRKGSDHSIQYSIVTGEESVIEAKMKIQDRRKFLSGQPGQPYIDNRFACSRGRIQMELELEYDIFNNTQPVESVAFQLYINDADSDNPVENNQLTWYPVGHSYINSFASFRVLFTEDENTLLKGESRLVITDNADVQLILFGAETGDRIRVWNQAGNDKCYKSETSSVEVPDSITLTSWELDLEKDTLYISINEEYTAMHDLFFATRRFEREKPGSFEREIRIFEAKDKLQMPDPGGVVFIGSSSIRMWNSVKSDFPELNVIQRGFGGSNSSDALMYMDKIVLPYNPQQVVYYEGDNDIPHGLSDDEIIGNMKKFIENILKMNQEVEIFLLSPVR